MNPCYTSKFLRTPHLINFLLKAGFVQHSKIRNHHCTIRAKIKKMKIYYEPLF